MTDYRETSPRIDYQDTYVDEGIVNGDRYRQAGNYDVPRNGKRAYNNQEERYRAAGEDLYENQQF